MMGITLYFGNQLKPLAVKLQENLSCGAPPADVFDPPLVIVPNMNLSKWIKLTLARRAGIFMNVSFEYLETGLWQMIRSLDPETSAAPERLDADCLTVLLYYILMQTDEQEPALAPVHRYLQADGDGHGGNPALRGWQLAHTLARLFQEYEYHRWDMVQAWIADRPTEDPMERCQQWVYRRMQRIKDELGRSTGRQVTSMVEYAATILDAAPVSAKTTDGDLPRVHFFGLSQISPLHVHLLSGLRSYFDIHIYSLNPSREYWEDIRTPREKKWIRRHHVRGLALSEAELSAGDLFSEPDHALLAAWGKPGRESIRLLCQLTDYDFHAGYAEGRTPDTILAAIAHGLLTLDGQRSDGRPLDQDRSLQITACPGIRREVETVYNSIVFNLEQDPALRTTDIAVMVSDMQRYKPVIDSVFGRQPVRITYNLVDSNARTESVVARAISAIAALARGNFSRKAVFDLLNNPCVMRKWRYDADDLTVWIGWADALGIFHHYENPQSHAEGLPSAGAFSWRQGLERLRLSRIMTAPDPSDQDGRHFNGLVPFAGMHTGDDRLVETFCRLVETLNASVGTLNRQSASAQTWRQAFFRVTDQFIEIGDDMRGEEGVYQSLVRAFDHFMRYDDLMRLQPGAPLTANALWAFISSHLEGITGGQGDYLTGGVTVSALMPMRPIPFKVVYVMGLEEGRFPGRSPSGLLDLRHRRRRIGDISIAERNRYLFLEILISVQSKLYLSYLNRDLQTDRDLAPCSVIHQLRRYVEQDIMGGEPFKIRQIPIRPDHPAYVQPDALTNWSDTMVESSPLHRLNCYRRNGLWDDFVRRATATEMSLADRFNPDFSSPETPPDPMPGQAIDLSTDMLRQLLLDPVQAIGQYHLNIGEHSDPAIEQAALEDEPVVSAFPMDYTVRTLPIKRWMVSQLRRAAGEPPMPSLEGEVERVYADLSRRSRVPVDAFGDHDRSRLKRDVLAMGERLLPFIEQIRASGRHYDALVVGDAAVSFPCPHAGTYRLEPLTVACVADARTPQPAHVRLNGSTPWIWQGRDETWHCLVVTGSNRKSRHADKYVLAPLLALMAATAGSGPCPWSRGGSMTLHVIYREHVLDLTYTLDPHACRDYLTTLVADFLKPLPLIWLPFETVFGHKKMRTLIRQDGIDDLDRADFVRSLSLEMDATADLAAELTGAQIPPDCLDRARRRFRIFASWQRHEHTTAD